MLLYYLDAFWELGTTRPRDGDGWEGPIPWDKIDRFGERQGFSGDAADRLLTIIRAVDGEYLRIKTKQVSEAREKQKALDDEEASNAGQRKAAAMNAARRKAGA